MTATNRDIVLANDFVTLAEDTRSQLPRFDDTIQRLRLSGGAYRDDRLGAEARRNAQLDQRRRELALMPLAIGRVFSHRVARAVAGAVALGCGLIAMVAVIDPLVLQIADELIPELSVSLTAAGIVIAVLGSYLIAQNVADWIYDRAMRRGISASDDVYGDLDALAIGPLETARGLARRVDGWSVGLPLAGLVAVVPLFGLLAVAMSVSYGMGARRLTMHIVDNAVLIAVPVLFALIGAFLLGRACANEHRGNTSRVLVAWLSHSAVLAVAVFLGSVALWGVARATLPVVRGLDWRPPVEMRVALGFAATFAISASAAWLLLWWRRREQARLD